MSTGSGESSELVLDARALVRNVVLICVGFEVLFFFLDYRIHYARWTEIAAIRRMFNNASEDGLGSWFAILQTAMVAVTLWIIWLIVRNAASRRRAAGWLLLALFFSYLALDDGAFVHERIGTAYNTYFADADPSSTFGGWSLEVFPSYRWQIVFLPIFGAAGAFMTFFLFRELRSWRLRIAVIAALTLLTAAVGLDFFEGLHETHPWNPYTAITERIHLDYWTLRTFDKPGYDTLLHFSKSLEECVEMFAMTLLWATFLSHLSWVARDLRVRFVHVRRPSVSTSDTAEAVVPARRAPGRRLLPRPS